MDRDGWQLAERRRGRPPRARRPPPPPRRHRGRRRGTGRRGRRLPSTGGASTGGEEGHVAARCKHPVRCLRCKQVGHKRRRLPQVLPAGRRVAPQPTCGAPGTDDDVTGDEEETEGRRAHPPATHRRRSVRRRRLPRPSSRTRRTALGARSLVVFHQDRRPVTAKEQENLEDEYNAYLIKEATAKAAADWMPEIAAPSRGQDPGAPGRRHRRERGADGNMGHGLGQAARGLGGGARPCPLSPWRASGGGT